MGDQTKRMNVLYRTEKESVEFLKIQKMENGLPYTTYISSRSL